ADGHRRRPRALCPLLHLRRPGRNELLPRALSLAALLALSQHELRAPDTAAHRNVLEPLAGNPHRRVPAGVPGDLLLLPPLLLPRVLLVAAGLRGPGRAQGLRRRDAISVPHPVPASLCPSFIDCCSHLPGWCRWHLCT